MSEIIKTLNGILSDSKEDILNTPHGERLTVNTRVAYVDKAYNCSDTFIKGTSIGILANLVVFIKGAENDEDPCYGYSMFIDLEKNTNTDTQLISEANEFLGMLADFTDELKATDDPEAVLKRFSEQADERAAEELVKFEESLNKTKKIAIIATACIIVLMIAVLVLKTFI
jgi:hypothetical protein